MTKPADISCDEFDQGVDELAVGTLAEPERTLLLDHAAGCSACETRLNWLAGLADRLLLLVPEVEPPAGFEAGVMARMGGAGVRSHGGTAVVDITDRASGDGQGEEGDDSSSAPSAPDHAAPRSGPRGRGSRRVGPARWRQRGWQFVAAAAVAIAVLAAGFTVGRTTSHPAPAAVARQGEITTIAGVDVGTAQVLAKPQPHILVSLKSPLPWGVLDCQLELAQGRRVTVGSWDYEDSPDGVWAMRIDPSLTGAVLMRIVDQNGAVVATAALD